MPCSKMHGTTIKIFKKSTIFFADVVSGVKNLEYVCSGFCVVSVFCSVWVHGFFIGFNLWVCPGFTFPVFKLRFNVLTATSLLLPSDKTCSQVGIITILLSYCTL
jgi:hypothetical protein